MNEAMSHFSHMLYFVRRDISIVVIWRLRKIIMFSKHKSALYLSSSDIRIIFLPLCWFQFLYVSWDHACSLMLFIFWLKILSSIKDDELELISSIEGNIFVELTDSEQTRNKIWSKCKVIIRQFWVRSW